MRSLTGSRRMVTGGRRVVASGSTMLTTSRMLRLVALVVHLLGHGVARVTIRVLVNRPRAKAQRRREGTRDQGGAPTQLVRIVLLSTHEDTLSR